MAAVTRIPLTKASIWVKMKGLHPSSNVRLSPAHTFPSTRWRDLSSNSKSIYYPHRKTTSSNNIKIIHGKLRNSQKFRPQKKHPDPQRLDEDSCQMSIKKLLKATPLSEVGFQHQPSELHYPIPFKARGNRRSQTASAGC